MVDDRHRETVVLYILGIAAASIAMMPQTWLAPIVGAVAVYYVMKLCFGESPIPESLIGCHTSA